LVLLDKIYPGETKAKYGFTGQAGFWDCFFFSAFLTKALKSNRLWRRLIGWSNGLLEKR
jgi:hypothetical protein